MPKPLWAAAALTLVACGGSERQPAPPTHAPPVVTSHPTALTGPEALVLRVPRIGGQARVYDYDRLDSAVWKSDAKAPAIARFLAFDEDGGAVAVVDARGAPRRIEFRTGTITAPPSVKLTALHSADGAAVYGVSATGVLTRLTPTDAAPWTLRLPAVARDVAPQTDGNVLVVGDGQNATTLWRVHPPATALLDSAVLPKSERLVHAAVGDRAYFASDSALRTVRTRDFKGAQVIGFPKRLRALAPTPSGDRVYIALDSAPELRIVDRYSDHDDASVPLPGPAAELRMDPLGRYLLVRPVRTPDSVWVVAMGTDHLVGTVHTVWTPDLPLVGVDGSIVVAIGPDIVLLDPQTLVGRRTVRGGASDFWIPLRWNGFRPRAPGLDQPVTFPGASPDTTDSILAAIRRSQADTSLHAPVAASSSATRRPVLDSAQGRLAPETTPAATPAAPAATPREPGYTVQFAALLNQDSARARAAHIAASGRTARVVTTSRGTATVYLVVLGPFANRGQAEAAARASKQPNPWVYEGAP